MYPSSLISLFTDPVHPELNPLPEVPQTPEVNSSPLFLVEPDPDWLSQICGGAAASLVLLAEYEIGALIILLVFVMVYDASDFIVGSGASNGIEGPVAGMLFIAVASAAFAELSAPPFNDHGSDIWSFSVLAMIACPAGQILASALLPKADAHAPALRRLDTLLVVAPAWAGLIGLYLARAV